ncbi:YqcC family protein [Budvicia diplopodorum]|uniref:YqcC family protein n=1 Tax=Budvicia diplopodorum TaxID=1119056 RepID=UPI0013581ACF|nr:YqcC family protein [Budvicia diplopodorum]
MSLEKQIGQILADVELLMQECDLWSTVPPESAAFESCEPFCIDTMMPEEWLQWVFISRMREILENQRPLPTNMAIAPYFEVSFSQRAGDYQPLLVALQNIDRLLNKEVNKC